MSEIPKKYLLMFGDRLLGPISQGQEAAILTQFEDEKRIRVKGGPQTPGGVVFEALDSTVADELRQAFEETFSFVTIRELAQDE